jgi:drug/metabolite transporter (DMT)-like permease
MILFFKALKQLEAIQVALSNFLITFFALPIAGIWLNERLSFLSIAGGLLVLTGTLCITVLGIRQAAPKINVANK